MENKIITIPKSTCPYIAIPIPGKRPFLVKRTVFQAATKGINMVSAELSSYESGYWLIVEHKTVTASGTVIRGRYKFRNQWSVQALDGVRRWAERERQKRAKVVTQGASATLTKKQAAQVAKWQRELAKLHVGDPPTHPFNRERYSYREYRASTATTPEVPFWWASWYSQRAMRKQIARIAGLVLKGKLSDRQAYTQLRELLGNVTFKTYGAMTGNQREAFDIKWADDYWKRLPRVIWGIWGSCSGNKPRDLCPVDFAEQLAHHRESVQEYLVRKCQAVQLQSLIANVKLSATPIPQGAPTVELTA